MVWPINQSINQSIDQSINVFNHLVVSESITRKPWTKSWCQSCQSSIHSASHRRIFPTKLAKFLTRSSTLKWVQMVVEVKCPDSIPRLCQDMKIVQLTIHIYVNIRGKQENDLLRAIIIIKRNTLRYYGKRLHFSHGQENPQKNCKKKCRIENWLSLSNAICPRQ